MRFVFRRSAVLLSVLSVVVAVMAFGVRTLARAQGASAADKPFVVEYYYKTKWGHADEFIALFRKNHYPVLKKEMEMGRLLKVSAVAPVYHTTEDGRWDYRVTIVFKNAAVANDGYDSAPLLKQLFPIRTPLRKKSSAGSRFWMPIGICR